MRWDIIAPVVQFLGLAIPMLGIWILLKREHTKTSTFLLLTNMASLVSNMGYFLFLHTKSQEGAFVAYRVQYIGEIFFYFFFILFLLSYLDRKISGGMMVAWVISETVHVILLWSNHYQGILFNKLEFVMYRQGFMSVQAESGILYEARYVVLILVLAMIMVGIIAEGKEVRERQLRINLMKLASAEFTVMTAFIVMQTFHLPFDIMPFANALSVYTILVGVMKGRFNVTDISREWLLDGMKERFIIVDKEYGYMEANTSAKEMFPELLNYTRGHRISERLYEVFTSEGDELILNGRHFGKKVREIRHGDVLYGYNVLLADCHEQYLLMEELKSAKERAEEGSRAKSTFVSTISHEIRTPMNVIIGMTDVLLRTKLQENQRNYLTNIHNSGETLLSIINDILDFSKIESGKLEITEDDYYPSSILNDINLIVLNRIGEKPVELIFDIDSNLPERLHGDGLRIYQVVLNLVNNAVKYTERGFVKLSIRVEEIDKETVRLHFSVKDSGKGIRPEDLEHLFEAFQQLDLTNNKYIEGTGLGLTISKQLVELMGGSIRVESTFGEGSEFLFDIPQKLAKTEVKKVEEEVLLNFITPNVKILIVDDNEMNLEEASEVLRPLQMQMDTASNGKQALEMIQDNDYHIVLMDHMMPIMDGVEAVQRLRKLEGEKYQKLPVIAVTANATTDAKEEFLQAGMNDFVPKPIRLKEIYEKLHKWLPAELIEEHRFQPGEAAEKKDAGKDTLPEIEGLDVAEGIQNCGTPEIFYRMLGVFYKLIDIKAKKIEECLTQDRIKEFTVEVHALKSTARMIGAAKLSELCARMEQFGKECKKNCLTEETPSVVQLYRRYKEYLKAYAGDGIERRGAETEELISLLSDINHGIDTFDLDRADAALKKLETCLLPEALQEKMEMLRACVADVAMEEIMRLTNEMIEYLRQEAKEHA